MIIESNVYVAGAAGGGVTGATTGLAIAPDTGVIGVPVGAPPTFTGAATKGPAAGKVAGLFVVTVVGGVVVAVVAVPVGGVAGVAGV